MAGTSWRAATPEITSTAALIEAASLDADSDIGFVVHRISVSIQAKGSETGKALIHVSKHDGSTGGGLDLTATATDGSTDTPVVAGKYYDGSTLLTGMANQKLVAAKYWPITSSGACTFDFSQLIGRPLKIVGDDGVLVEFTGPTGATTSTYTVSFEGEE